MVVWYRITPENLDAFHLHSYHHTHSETGRRHWTGISYTEIASGVNWITVTLRFHVNSTLKPKSDLEKQKWKKCKEYNSKPKEEYR